MANWEVIHRTPENNPGHTITDKMEVSGGWLYRTRVWGHGAAGKGLPPALSMAFVPDPISPLLGNVRAADFDPSGIQA